MKLAALCVLAVSVMAEPGKREQQRVDEVAAIDWAEVRQDIRDMFLDSQASWPADYGTYAPFFLRLAWHCTGTYRVSDGLGGCDGARQR
jgi:catalase-peroxidase